MTFEDAMHKTCRLLGYDSNLKYIQYKKDAHTYAEKIAIQYGIPRKVKNSYMFLDCVDFCFFQNGNDVNFTISGVISRNDKINIKNAIEKALEICSVCEWQMQYGDIKAGGKNE